MASFQNLEKAAAAAATISGNDTKVRGIIRQVDPEGLRTLLAENERQLEENNTTKSKQEEIQAEYQTLGERLKTLPDKIRYEALVPIGPLVMAPGTLIHTNEITIHLGDNWFIQCSAKSALKICAHRLQKSTESIAKLTKENELLVNWKAETMRQLTESTSGGTVEIEEEYNEELETQWKVKHRENVRKYYQELSQNKISQKASKEEEELWSRLDELELEEEMELYEASKKEMAVLQNEIQQLEIREKNEIRSKEMVKSESESPPLLSTSESETQPTNTKSGSFEIIEVKEYTNKPKSQNHNPSILKSISKENLESSSSPKQNSRKVSFNPSKDSTKEYELSESSETEDDGDIVFMEPEATSKSETFCLKSITERSVVNREDGDYVPDQRPPERVSLYKQKFWKTPDESD